MGTPTYPSLALAEVMPRNEALWSAGPEDTRPSPHSVLRSRSFWRTLYRLDADGDALGALWSVERHRFDYWDGFLLSVESAPYETVLHIAGHEAARLDESVTMPHFFRWSEIQAIARHFEARSDSPRNPSVTALLLAPFLAVTDTEQSVSAELTSELGLLGLLSADEISEIVAQCHVPESDWVANPDVGWSLLWRAQHVVTTGYQPSPIYSQRIPGAPFAAPLLELLRF